MKKKLLSIFLVLCMALTLLPIAALAADGDGSNVGTEETTPETTSLPSVDESGNITLANNATYQLTAETTLTGVIKVGENVTAAIDLNGNTLKGKDGSSVIEITKGGALTIVNTGGSVAEGNNTATGVITTATTSVSGAQTPALIKNEGTLNLEAGTLSVPNNLAYYGVLNQGVFTMGTDASSAVAIQGGTKNALLAKGTTTGEATVDTSVTTTIHGGTITGGATTIYNLKGTLTINSATVNVTTGQIIISNGGLNEGKTAYVKGGALTINGGTFNSTAKVMISTASETTISGGTFTLARTGDNGDQSYIMSISGGAGATLSNCTLTNNTTRDGGAIGSDFGICGTGTGTVTIGENVTISSPNAALKDLNADSAKIVINGGELTSTGAEAVKITAGNAESSTITVNGGAIKGKTNGIQVSAGTVTIQGGTITGETEAAVEVEGTSAEFKGLTIQDGQGTSPTLTGGGEGTPAVSVASGQTNGTVSVTGGTFSSDVSAYMSGSSTLVKNDGGQYVASTLSIAEAGYILNGTTVNNVTGISDGANYTMYVKLNGKTSSPLWFVIEGPNDVKYGIAGDAGYTNYCWSFLNKAQFESWPENVNPGAPAEGDYKVTVYTTKTALTQQTANTFNANGEGVTKIGEATVKVSNLPEITTDYILDDEAATQALGFQCADYTMYVKYSEALPKGTNLWYVITDPNGTEYGIASSVTEVTKDGKTLATNLDAWSFNNKSQFEGWPKKDGTDVALGVTSGEYAIDIYQSSTKITAAPENLDGMTKLGETLKVAVVGKEVTVTFNLDGGTLPSATGGTATTVNGKLTTLPEPSKEGCSFDGWYTDDVTKVTTDTVFYADTTVTAKWTSTEYTVTFDSQGGSAVANVTVAHGGKVSKPTDPARSGYTFGGWFKEAACITAWDFNTDTIEAATTLYAKWTVNSSGGGGGGSSGGGSSSGGGGGSSGTTYAVTAPSVTTGGTVSVSPSKAAKGATVTITAKAKSGYEVDAVTVTTTSGSKVTVTDKGSGKYTFTMPSGKVTVDVTFKETTPAKPDTPTTPTGFTDVPANAYYADAVAWAVEKGITQGTGDDKFSPNKTCTRAEAVTFLWRAAGSPAAKGSTTGFVDAQAGSWYYDAMLWAVEQGITRGTSENTFSPNATCSRDQIVTFLYRAAGSPAMTGTHAFTDVEGGAFYADAVKWAVTNGVTNGTSETTFSPGSDCTRAQIVTFLYRAQ